MHPTLHPELLHYDTTMQQSNRSMRRLYMKPLVFPVEQGTPIDLSDYNPRYKADLSRSEGESQFDLLANQTIDELQELLYAAGTHSVLIILQGMDTSGKDGTIRNVFGHVSPIGCRVKAFKTPTEEELAHDFLWRVHQHTPKRGEITLFNRSHYEDVLIARVHNLVPEEVWQQRYRQINDFERLLGENNTIVLKFFLHISKEEQEERLRKREADINKAWKLSPADWEERRCWDDYQAAYVNVLNKCSPPEAPWYIVPADRKWFRNLAVAHTVVEVLSQYKGIWVERLDTMNREALAALERVRGTK